MSKARFSAARELALAGRVLDQLHRTGAHDVAQVGLGLRAERQDDGRHGRGGPQAGQPGHAGVAVEDRPGDEHVERSLLTHLVDHVDDVGAGDDLVARAERGLDGPAERRRAADDENPAGDHGALVVWSVPMHWPTGGGTASCCGLDDRERSRSARGTEVSGPGRVSPPAAASRTPGSRPAGAALLTGCALGPGQERARCSRRRAPRCCVMASSVHGSGIVAADRRRHRQPRSW